MTAAKIWFGLMLLSGGLAIYFFIHPPNFNFKTNIPNAASLPVITPVPVVALPLSTTSGVRLAMLNPSVTALGTNKWKVVLPGDMEYDTGIPVKMNQTVKTSELEGLVKLDPRETFVNRPAGTIATNTPGLSNLKSESYITDEAWVGALIGRVGSQSYADIGGRLEQEGVKHNSFTASQDGTFVAAVNCLQGEKLYVTGGYTFIVEVE